mmetsp:Transcript_91809/g.262549  ORF Transcript_91809/g.262549 Transcript_91809/m.262549 type:complete len:366 (+) Transcript_91809:561-1658(+)
MSEEVLRDPILRHRFPLARLGVDRASPRLGELHHLFVHCPVPLGRVVADSGDERVCDRRVRLDMHLGSPHAKVLCLDHRHPHQRVHQPVLEIVRHLIRRRPRRPHAVEAGLAHARRLAQPAEYVEHRLVIQRLRRRLLQQHLRQREQHRGLLEHGVAEAEAVALRVAQVAPREGHHPPQAARVLARLDRRRVRDPPRAVVLGGARRLVLRQSLQRRHRAAALWDVQVALGLVRRRRRPCPLRLLLGRAALRHHGRRQRVGRRRRRARHGQPVSVHLARAAARAARRDGKPPKAAQEREVLARVRVHGVHRHERPRRVERGDGGAPRLRQLVEQGLHRIVLARMDTRHELRVKIEVVGRLRMRCRR